MSRYSPRTTQPDRALVARWGAPSLIKYAQSGVTSLASAASTTVTLANTVDLSNTLLAIGGPTSIAANDFSEMLRVELTNPTTITVSRFSTGAGPSIAGWSLLEFWPGVLSRTQVGGTTMSGTTVNQTIAEVNPAKALLLWQGYRTTAALSTAFQPTMSISSPTNIQFRCANSSDIICYWQVVEFF